MDIRKLSINKLQNGDFWKTGQPSESTQENNIMEKPKIKNNAVFKKLGIVGVVLLVVLSIIFALSYMFVLKPILTLTNEVNVLKKDMSDISSSLLNRDLITMEVALSNTEKDLAEFTVKRDAELGWMKNVSLFKINEFYSDTDKFVNAGNLAIKAMRQTIEIVTPFADAAGLRIREDQEIVQTEGLKEAFQTWVSLMPEVSQNMDAVLETLNALGEELATVDTTKYPEEFNGMMIRSNVEFAKNTLSQAKEFAPDIKTALNIIPNLLGVDSYLNKRYMIIMQNNMELRPTGGFWTNYATFQVRDAWIQSDFSSKDFYSIDNTLDVIDSYYDFPDAPAAYSKFLAVERWYARDTNSSPDLPTSIDQFMFYYNLGNKVNPTEIKPIEGIITIDTQVIKELLEVTGPVTVNGITYNSDNVVLELERLASLNVLDQINRKGVLGDLLEEMQINVFESDSFLWSKLIDKGVSLAMRKHIQGYLFDEQGQALLERYGFAGRISDPVDSDYAYVVSTNLGGDKTNWFTTKTVNHKLEKIENRWLRTVEISYDYRRPGEEFSPFIKRFRDWVRVYVPAGSELVSFDGTEDTTAIGTGKGTERNKEFFYGYVELGPDEKKTLTVKYYLPDGLIKDNNYTLLIQKQPGIIEETHSVTVNNKTTEFKIDKDKKVSIKL